MKEFRYTLEKGGKKFSCPKCCLRKLSRYVDTHTGEQLPEKYGRCDRESSCGYHLNPYKDGYVQENSLWKNEKYFGSLSSNRQEMSIPKEDTANVFIPKDLFKRSRKAYHLNNFALFLFKRFGKEIASRMIARYHLGTSKHWLGATIFWQIDVQNIVRAGKIMLYDQTTLKRVKKPFNHITWIHKVNVEQFPSYKLKQSIFGEHLLKKHPEKIVAIVESEKTAIISSEYLPQYVWLASGSLSNLSIDKCQVLQNRKVVLFPDLKCYEMWSVKAKELSLAIPNAKIAVSEFLERVAIEAERQLGSDLADYLLRFTIDEFNIHLQDDDSISPTL